MKQILLILLILILSAASAQAQTSAAAAAKLEKPKAKLLVSWQPKNCRACQTKTIDGQEFQIISDENVTLAFHGGTGADFLVGDVYIINKSRLALSFDPEKDLAVSAWTDASKAANRPEILRPLTGEEALSKMPRPEFWSKVAREMGEKTAAEQAQASQAVLLKAGTVAPGKNIYGSIYFPKNETREAISFNITLGDRIYSFAFRNPKNYSGGAK